MKSSSQNNNLDIWNKAWFKYEQNQYSKPNLKVVNEILNLFSKNIENKKILEIGAGSGWDACYLAKNKACVTVLDFSEISIKICKNTALKTRTKLNYILGDCQNTKLKSNQFDLIYSVGLFEHFKAYDKLIKEQIRLVKPNGYILIDVPQKYNPYTLVKKIRMANRTFPFGWETEYSLLQLKKIFLKYNLEYIRCYGRGSSISQKLPKNIKPIWNFFIKCWEKTIFAPHTCLCLGVIFKKTTKLKQ